ncbi:unnamed protein product [Adineta steineri]|uniref:Uncharacterized protein n=1 Tax=Adineta steineri TaxID=433720 RepID=A0A814IM75_9BILA|nr:unnamed protein product [Adineta steineri]CAF1043737.1 unnamed protein product [Adineta steineri]CAF1357150.1 unnamed protein product [Adineta steineri]CAF1599081.1 unnamed protein product [Adineta steineri]
MRLVSTINEFQGNLATRFLSDQWLGGIDFSQLTMLGGCILNALYDLPFSDTTEQDVNLIYLSNNGADFEIIVMNTIIKLQAMASKCFKEELKVEKTPGRHRYDVVLPCGVKLNFFLISTGNSKSPLSHVLHNFDMDISQVAFTGDRIISTFAFLQALATKSFIVYSLHAETSKNVCNRIAKYCKRGFTLLEPINFDGSFDMLMKQLDIPLYRIEYQDFTDDDGEVQFMTTEYWRGYARNIDTFQLQEGFIAAACSTTLEYKQ